MNAPGSELFAALPVAAVIVDSAGCIVRVNAACETLFNQSERALTGRSLSSLLGSSAGDAQRRNGQGFAAYDVELERERGWRTRVDHLEAEVGTSSGWRVVTLHERPATLSRGLAGEGGAGTRSAIGAAAMLAHEIKNPLSGIRGAAQLLARGGEEEQLTRLITTEVDRIVALIDRMQDFTDVRPPSLRPENVYPLLAHARQVAEAGFAHGVVIEERFDPSLPPVMVDRDALLQVLLNLMKNACEALVDTASPRMILTTAYRHGMAVNRGVGQPSRPLPIELGVFDNGPGPAADIEKHLFEPFVSGRREGTGLGLALVDKLVRDMGGIVQYTRDEVPRMTMFRVLLPRA